MSVKYELIKQTPQYSSPGITAARFLHLLA